MHPRDIYVPEQGPPQTPGPSKLIYAEMGEANIFRMLHDFYAALEQSEVRHLFPPDMAAASEKSGAFFVFLLGGPPLYHQRFGPPMMRRRHIPFRIDEEARQVWLRCFNETLVDAETKYNFPAEHKAGFIAFLESFSGWMVNTR